MKAGMTLFFVSAYWAIAGSFMGIFGGMLGSSFYFLAKTGKKAG
ncbi:hypothetical protein [Cytobacillus firmus]|nr:hypothetical protein [Cytobacillus firmus]